MKNVTISMDDDLLAWVRVEAGKAGVSVSRWLADSLAKSFNADRERAEAIRQMDEFFENGPRFALSDENGKITIDRDEMYDERFRRFDHPPVSTGHPRGAEEGRLRGVAEAPSRFRSVDDEPSGSE